MKFYVRLVALLRRMIVKLGLRLCAFNPYGIGLTERDKGGVVEFYPVYRDIYHATGLGELCSSFQPVYNPTSVEFGDLEMTEIFQKRIEIYSAGLTIYYMEVNYAFMAYQNNCAQTNIPEWVLGENPSAELFETFSTTQEDNEFASFSMKELFKTTIDLEETYRHTKGTLSRNYSNSAFKNNLRFLRQTCGKYFELNPIVDSAQNINYTNCMNLTSSQDANTYMTQIYSEFFVFVDSMTNQNNGTLFQRPTCDEAITKFSDFQSKFEEVFRQIPNQHLVFTNRRLLI